MASPTVLKYGALAMQVCVPKDWTDQKVKEFAEGKYPCGTENGWFIRKEGPDPERVQCADNADMVHVVLDA